MRTLQVDSSNIPEGTHDCADRQTESAGVVVKSQIEMGEEDGS